MTDDELMNAICNGDQSAYKTVVKQHLPAISHYAFRLLGNKKDTEDITQETFLKLWLNANSWRPDKGKVTTWLHRIAHNLCIDYLRKHSKVQTQEDFEEVPTSDLDDSTNGSSNTDKMQILDQALMQLPESQRSAIMLCAVQNFSNKEAADIMAISVKALESTVARGKRSLRKIVHDLEQKSNAQLGQPKKAIS